MTNNTNYSNFTPDAVANYHRSIHAQSIISRCGMNPADTGFWQGSSVERVVSVRQVTVAVMDTGLDQECHHFLNDIGALRRGFSATNNSITLNDSSISDASGNIAYDDVTSEDRLITIKKNAFGYYYQIPTVLGNDNRQSPICINPYGIINLSFIDRHSDYYSFPSSHGTHTCGIVSMAANFSINQRNLHERKAVQIMPVKFGYHGINLLSASQREGDYSIQNVYNDPGTNAICALQQLCNEEYNNVRVVNISARFNYHNYSFKLALQALTARHKLIVISAGNEGELLDNARKALLSYNNEPEFAKRIIIVGATKTGDDGQEIIDEYSSYINNPRNEYNFILAPGSSITSLSPLFNFNSEEKISSSQETMSGTSMAAPVVSGILARAIQKYPLISIDNIRRALFKSADDVYFYKRRYFQPKTFKHAFIWKASNEKFYKKYPKIVYRFKKLNLSRFYSELESLPRSTQGIPTAAASTTTTTSSSASSQQHIFHTRR